MIEKNSKEIYFAVRNTDQTILNTSATVKSRNSYSTLSRLRSAINRLKLDKRDYTFYKIYIYDNFPVIERVEL